jgi:hypothetical protein
MRALASPFALSAFVLAAALTGFAPQIFNDADTWWHLAAGDWILAHRAVPVRDFFTHTFAGIPWNAHEWLSEVLMALAYRAGGWSGLYILFGGAFGITAAVVAGTMRRQVDIIPAFVVSMLGLACVSGSLLARPHLLALPLLALWTATLVDARRRDVAPSFWLAAVMLIWANLHGSFALGLALTLALGFEAVAASRERLQTAQAWGTFFAIAILAALATPQGLEGLLFPARLLTMPGMASIGEWRPADLTRPAPFLLAVGALILVLAAEKVRLPKFRALLVVAFLYLGLAHVRHQMLFGIVAPLLAGPALGIIWPASPQVEARWSRPLLTTLVLGLIVVRLMLPTARGEDRVSPVAALAHVPVALRGKPVLNAYDYGGYLIHQGVPVFIDGRTDLYPSDFMKADDRLAAGDEAALMATLARYHIAWTIYPAGSAAAKALDGLAGWRRLYADGNAVVHVPQQQPPG